MQDDIFLKESREVASNLLEILELELDELRDIEKDLISAYSFGIIVKMAEENSISEELENMATKKMLVEILKYTDKEAEKILKKLSNSIQKNGDEGFQIMIYQGESLYQDYKGENYNEIYNNLTSMMDVVIRKDYESY